MKSTKAFRGDVVNVYSPFLNSSPPAVVMPVLLEAALFIPFLGRT